MNFYNRLDKHDFGASRMGREVRGVAGQSGGKCFIWAFRDIRGRRWEINRWRMKKKKKKRKIRVYKKQKQVN